MYSQSNRIFSQGGELSQLASQGLSSQKSSKINKNELHNEGAQSCNKPLVSQTDVHEEQFSLRADIICKENQQIKNLVVNRLKKIEKKRIKLTNIKAQIEETEKVELEIHQRQSQQLLDLKMSLEKVSEQLRNQLDQRPKLLHKLKNIQYLGDVFQENFNEAVRVMEDLKKSEKYLKDEFEQRLTDKTKINKNVLKEEFEAEWVKFIKTSQSEIKALFEERKKRVCEIQTLALENEEELNEIQAVDVELNNETANYNSIIQRIEEATQQKKMLTEEDTLLHQELDDLRANSATLVQNIKLQINTEQHNNSNLERKRKENEDYLNNRSNKLKERLSLLKQIETAVKETSNSNEVLRKKTKYCEERNAFLKNQNDTIFESVKQYENVETENMALKKDIATVGYSIDEHRRELEVKDETIKHLNNEVEDLTIQLHTIEDNIAQLEEKLIMITKNNEELAAKLNQDKLNNQRERQNKVKRNQNVELKIISLSQEEENLSKRVKECNDIVHSLKLEEQEIKELIKSYKEEAEQSKTKLFNEENDFTQDMLSIDEVTSNDKEILDHYEDRLIELKPELGELPLNIELNTSLDQTLRDQEDKYREDCKNLEQNFSHKIKELQMEIETYCPIMDSLIAAEEKETEKIKEEIKETEDNKINLETNLRKLHEDLQIIINVEQRKRSKIVKMEKRLKAVRKETVVTHQDISDWSIIGKDQNKTKEWVESVPVDNDEYEFTEI